MPIYECNICNIHTTILTHYNRHLNTLKHKRNMENYNTNNTIHNKMTHYDSQIPTICSQKSQICSQNSQIDSHKSQQLLDLKCKYCNKVFTRNNNLQRHIKKYCKQIPQQIIESNNYLELLNETKNTFEKEKQNWEKEKQELCKQVTILLDKVGDTNIQNNIILNSYGNEDLSHITNKLKNSLLKIPYGAIPKMIEVIHFNDNKPENKNIMLPNKKDNLVKVFQGEKWIYKNKNEAITDLVDSKYMIIDDHYNEISDDSKIAPHVKSQYIKFRKFYDEGDADLVDKLKKECELVLLNNR